MSRLIGYTSVINYIDIDGSLISNGLATIKRSEIYAIKPVNTDPGFVEIFLIGMSVITTSDIYGIIEIDSND